jgi:hypothetical protein
MLQDNAVTIPGANIRSLEITEIGEALILRQKHLKSNGEIVFSKNEEYTLINGQNERSLVQQGDIIMATQGSLSLIGNMYQYNLPMQAIAASPLIIIRPNVNPEELYSLLEAKYYHIKTMVQNFTNIPRININQINAIEL